MFVETSTVVDYIDLMLNGVEGQTVTINATDGNPQDKQIDTIRAIKIWPVLRIKLNG